MPETKGDYRIVELYVNDTPHFLFQHGNQKYHKQVLKDFLDENKLEYKESRLPDESDIGPLLKNEGVYSVNGMGEIYIEPENKKVHYPRSSSANYEIMTSDKFNMMMMLYLENKGFEIIDTYNRMGRRQARYTKYSTNSFI